MHKVVIPQSVIDRVVKRRGTEHIFANFDPAKAALLVVDMQNGFMMPGVAHALCEMAPKIVPNVNRIADAMRKTGGIVVWIKNTFTDETLASWSVHHEMAGPEQAARRRASMTAGSKGHQLWHELDVQREDLIVQKTRYSAFIQGSSDLEAILRARGIDTVVITGTVTNVCCESTARDAMMRNFKTIMITDANAAESDEEHNASLIAIYHTFGDIMSTDLILALLARDASGRHTTE